MGPGGSEASPYPGSSFLVLSLSTIALFLRSRYHISVVVSHRHMSAALSLGLYLEHILTPALLSSSGPPFGPQERGDS